MNNEIEISANEIVEYMLNEHSTIRKTAEHFNCSVGTIWNRLHSYNGANKEKLLEQLKANTEKGQKQLNEKKAS